MTEQAREKPLWEAHGLAAPGTGRAVEAFEGLPNLIIRILLPSTAASDRVTRFDLYEAYGVRDSWIVGGEKRNIELYAHDKGRLQRAGAYTGGTFRSLALKTDVFVAQIFPY